MLTLKNGGTHTDSFICVQKNGQKGMILMNELIRNYKRIPNGWSATVDGVKIGVKTLSAMGYPDSAPTLIDWQTTLPGPEAESESWLPAILGTILQHLQSTNTNKIGLTCLCTASGLENGSAILTEITKHTSITWLSPNSIKTGLITLTASSLASLRELCGPMSTVILTGRVIVHVSDLSPSTLCATAWQSPLI